MGREYFGSISGKFCFGVQESSDIENLIYIDHEDEYTWIGCNCDLKYEDIQKNKYCSDCFESYEEHYETIKDDYDLEKGTDDETILYIETSNINYTIEKSDHYEELVKSLEDLKKLLPKTVIEEFDKIGNNEEIIDGYSDIFKDVYDELNKYNETDFHKLLVHFSRYKIGMQIKYVLEKEESCFVSCET